MTLPLEHGLLFAHTPKTAGTSFRISLVDYIGKERVICDYSQGNDTTSQLVEQHYYQARDSHHFGKKLAELKQRFCLTGHFAVPRHSAFFQARNIIIFFRDPLQQVLSHYGHRQRVSGFSGDLEAFCKIPAHRDVQAKTLATFPLHLLGYIGLQEHYTESLQSINNLYDLSLQEQVANVNKDRESSGGKAYTCSAEDELLIREYNQRDFVLYEKAKRLFFQRREVETDGEHFVHGCVTLQTVNRVEGWALRHDDSQPVDVTVIVNSKPVVELRAKDFRVALKGWNAPRHGFVGFTHLFKHSIAKDDVVECRVSSPNQLLFSN